MATRLQSVRKKDQCSRQWVPPKSLLFSPSQKDIKASSLSPLLSEKLQNTLLSALFVFFLLKFPTPSLSKPSLLLFLLLLFQNLLSFFFFFFLLRSMALTSSQRAELPQPKQLNYRETSPERTKIWIEPMPKTNRKVAVVYYLCRNGLLEHPHFIEVPLSSPNGLYLKGKEINILPSFLICFSNDNPTVHFSDFINRLNFLRGKSIAAMYSWSSKRYILQTFRAHSFLLQVLVSKLLFLRI